LRGLPDPHRHRHDDRAYGTVAGSAELRRTL
jgi:hypothetical protein